MSQRTRRTRFEERVRIERDFLAPVNNHFGSVVVLSGMTAKAIDAWQKSAVAASIPLDVKAVAVLLREAAARAELLADNSRDVFVKGRAVGADGLEVLRRQLYDLLHPSQASVN